MAESSSTDISDEMMPDEMLTVLQTEMDSIREDHLALKAEIEAIKAKFYDLINSCAFENSSLSLTPSLVGPEPVCTSPQPAKIRTETPGKDRSPVEVPAKGGCSYGDKMIQMLLEMPSSYLDDSEQSDSPPLPNNSEEHINGDKASDKECLSSSEAHANDQRSDVVSNIPNTSSYSEDFNSKPFLDSIRFNPASVLNSTSICAFDDSRVMLNCTPAEAYASSVNYPPALVNPASVLNCTPAGPVQSMISYNSANVHPASVSDCSPAEPDNLLSLQDVPARDGLCRLNNESVGAFPKILQSNQALSDEGSEQQLRVNPLKTAPGNAAAVDSLSSMISFNSNLINPSSKSGYTQGVEYHPKGSLSVTKSTSDPENIPSRDREERKCPSQANPSYVHLSVTPAVLNVETSGRKVLHSTPAVCTDKHGHIMASNLLNPSCSAIVDYSVSSTDSDQSDSSSTRNTQSADSSDVQPYPDRQAEMMSRMKYYSDFTIDRQRKINRMRNHLDITPCPDRGASPHDDVPNDTLCRFVEGAEDHSHQVCLIGPPYSRSGSIGSSSSGGSSTLQKTAVSRSRNSNSPSPKETISSHRVLKSTENTRHHNYPEVSARRSIISNKASSTTSGNSTSPSSSVYAWSLQSSSNDNTNERSHRRHRKSGHGESKRGDKRPRSSRRRSTTNHISNDEEKHAYCRDHEIHTMLGQPCNQVIKYLPIQPCYPKDLVLSNDSLYDDGYKSQTLPRSSTKKSLNTCSRNSSLEAKRNSVPDICALKSPPNSALLTSRIDSTSSKYPVGRLGCIGTSTTSGSQDSQTGTDSSAPLSKGGPSSSLENNDNTALTDSILTDSPKSVSSSGIFAPCNSPDATVGSRISCSTIADTQSIDLRGISVIQPNASALHGISAIQSHTSITSEFKVPKAPPPRKSSRRKGNRCSTPDVRTSTPKPNSYPNSVQSEQISRRKLFSSSSSTHSSQGSSSRLLDKKSVIKKFRRFSENFYKTKSGKIQIETLANL